MTVLDGLIVALYIAGMIVLGLVVARRIHTFRDYFIAGGRMTTPLLVCTLVSTYYGLDVLFGVSEVSFQEGVVAWFVYARPYYLVILLATFTVARQLRKFDFLSLPDVGARFFGRGTQATLGVASFLYSLPILAFMGTGVVLDVTLGIPFAWGVILSAAVAVAYTTLGGLLAAAFTDTIQFVLMCVTVGIACVITLSNLGGFAALERELPATFFEPWGTYPPGVLIIFAATALSALIEPAFYQRIFAAVNYRAIVIALLVGIVLWAAFDWVVTVLGMAAQVQGIDVEPRYALLTTVIDVLPLGLKGLFVAAVLAIAMSTIDSYLIIAAGNLSYDLYWPLSGRPVDDRNLLTLTRWMIVLSAAAAVALALFFQTVVSAWIFMSSVLVAAGFVPILAGLYLPRFTHPKAGLLSSVGGIATAMGYYVIINVFGEFDDAWGTQILSVPFGDRTIALWQEYALFIAVPASAVAYVIGWAWGRRTA